MKKVTLISGSILEIDLAPFSDANKLNRAFAKELKNIILNPDLDLTDVNFLKEIACSAIDSDDINAALELCFKRCLYNGKKVSLETFESEDARADYFQVCQEVIKENIRPFTTGLLSMLGIGNSEIKGL